MLPKLSHDSVFWRRLAHAGARYGPEWWVRWSPPAFGLAAAALLPEARRQVRETLTEVHEGKASRWRTEIDVARTFSNYACALADGLSTGSTRVRALEMLVTGEHNVRAALDMGRGVIFATAHTAGWELVAPLLSRHCAVDTLIVMQAERDAEAERFHDQSRSKIGLHILRPEDAFGSLALLRQLRKGHAVAMQVDRLPTGMRGRQVTMFGADRLIPDGPLRLAQMSGAPLMPVFSTRIGFRQYRLELGSPIRVQGRGEAALDAAAAELVDSMQRFVARNPTQWFNFVSPPRPDRKSLDEDTRACDKRAGDADAVSHRCETTEERH